MRYISVLLLIGAGFASDKMELRPESTSFPYQNETYRDFNYSKASKALILWAENDTLTKTQKISPPNIQLLLPPKIQEFYEWGEQVRYSIAVSDTLDGASKYGEIDGSEVVLEIEFLPIVEAGESSERDIQDKMGIAEKEPENFGLSIMKKSTCFGCHADKRKHTGPSFAEIAEKYEYSSGSIKSVARAIREGSKGIWGTTEMPSNPELSLSETQQIAIFMLKQGAKKNNWILPGLEGTFRITEKPKNVEKGLYVLTASYTSSSKARGQHTIAFRVR